jgi:hypothetical protein
MLSLGHARAAGDDVDDRGQHRDEDQPDHPQHLRAAAEFVVPEQVDHDLKHDDQIGHEEEGRHHQPDHVPEVAHAISSMW